MRLLISSSLVARTESALINQQSPRIPCITSLEEAPSSKKTGSSPSGRYSSGRSHSKESGGGNYGGYSVSSC